MPRNTLNDFWLNIMHAFQCMPPLLVPNGPRLTDRTIEKDFRLAAHTADGFQPEAFPFLPKDELARLTQSVEGVRVAASKLGAGVSMAEEARQEALPHFQAIVNILEPDRFMNPEAFALGKTIEQKLLPKPQHLDHLRFMSGPDSTGDPALWIWAFVDETDEYDDARFLERAGVIEDVLEPIAREVAPEGRVYLHFRSTSDVPEVQGVPA